MASTLRDREIVIAGGSGGLGGEAARMLAAEGARVVVSYARGEQRARAFEPLAEVVRADLRSAEDRARLLDAAPALYGLVVYAGMAARSEELLAESIEVNFVGPVQLAREAAARMKQAGTPGAIVLVATMQAAAVFAGSTAYAAPKAALVHAARILAKECRGAANIRVNVVSPGVIEAGIALQSIAQGKYQRYLEEGAIARYGHPRDVARAVRLLLEPDCYITGQVLTVDGGLTL
jgi:3-oxoacyl-[acyl-carrier protein] reductase